MSFKFFFFWIWLERKREYYLVIGFCLIVIVVIFNLVVLCRKLLFRKFNGEFCKEVIWMFLGRYIRNVLEIGEDLSRISFGRK